MDNPYTPPQLAIDDSAADPATFHLLMAEDVSDRKVFDPGIIAVVLWLLVLIPLLLFK